MKQNSGGAGMAEAPSRTQRRHVREKATIDHLVQEVYEPKTPDEVRVEVSEDGGRSYRQILVQEYSFSPGGATYQREEQRFTVPPGHPSPPHDYSKQERFRHGDAHRAPPFRLEA